jgi:hypothetical protein
MSDDLLQDILNYNPAEDPTQLLSRAYNEIENLRRHLLNAYADARTPDRVAEVQP